MEIRTVSHTPSVRGTPLRPADDTPSAASGPQNRPVAAASVSEASLTESELKLLAELKQIDIRVRQHEMAHIAAGAGVVSSGISYTYQKGPDGKNYAVGGEVRVDTAPIPGDPEATLRKMQRVRQAAMAPADPSPQDLQVASKAASLAAQASAELASLTAAAMRMGSRPRSTGIHPADAAETYDKISNLPADGSRRLNLAV